MGTLPPLVGWAAATGRVGWPALLLGALVFFWQPPHVWALGLARSEEYRHAGIPLLPVVRGGEAVGLPILAYAVATVATSLALIPLVGGRPYAVAAALPGLGLLAAAWRVAVLPSPRNAAQLFHYSVVYLGVLFLAIVAIRLAP